jgi:hypothetical protein
MFNTNLLVQAGRGDCHARTVILGSQAKALAAVPMAEPWCGLAQKSASFLPGVRNADF